jgi:plasmid stabilization system protein ParE
MANRVRLRPEAEQDLRDACDWYETRRPGPGGRLYTAVESKIEAIGQNPRLYSIVLKTYRRTILSRFPYAIVYESRSDGVTILAVYHTARDP